MATTFHLIRFTDGKVSNRLNTPYEDDAVAEESWDNLLEEAEELGAVTHLSQDAIAVRDKKDNQILLYADRTQFTSKGSLQ